MKIPALAAAAFLAVAFSSTSQAAHQHVCIDAARSQPLWCNDHVQKAAKTERKHVVKAKPKKHKHRHHHKHKKHRDWKDWFKHGHKHDWKYRAKRDHDKKHWGHGKRSHKVRDRGHRRSVPGFAVNISRPDIRTPDVRGFWR